MQIDLIARIGTKDEFITCFKDGDEKQSFEGLPLIFFAAANTNPEVRYDICNFLLDRNADVTVTNKENQGILHIILGHVEQDILKLTELCKRLIEKGANINLTDKHKTIALKTILASKFTDAELSPLYDLWFSQPYVELNIRDKWGLTPIEFAQKFPYRNEVVKRMMTYVTKS
jgi:ankyrin repeat protein